ncbi:MAG: response regulator [Bacteroidia bacterium]
MNTEIKIGIVEDELLIAEKIKTHLISMGYEVCEPVSSYEEALEMIDAEKPDMLLLDINLNNKKDGIHIAEKVNQKYKLPFIFLTANSDMETIERAKEVKPNAYLVKPYTKEELYAAIEIAFNNYSKTKSITKPSETTALKDYIFIREQHKFVKILFSEIVYAESCENYVVIHTKEKKSSIIRSTFNDFLEQLPSEKFYRTHRSFAVQLNMVDNIEPTEVVANGFKIPVSNTYRAGLFSVLGIKE